MLTAGNHAFFSKERRTGQTVKPTESFVAECKKWVGLPLPFCVGFVLVFNLYDPVQVNSICTSKRISLSTLLQSTTMNKYKVHVRLELQCCSFEISLLPTQESVCWSNIGKQHSCKFKNYISANSSAVIVIGAFCLSGESSIVFKSLLQNVSMPHIL